MKVDLKKLRDNLYLEIVDEAMNVVLSRTDGGNEICDKFEPSQQLINHCRNCAYTQYIHLCKKILKLNLLVGMKDE